MVQEAVAAPDVLTDPVQPWRGWTREHYEALVGTGALEDEHVELLEGVLAEMTPQSEQHAGAAARLGTWLARHLPEPWILRSHSPLAAGRRSVPEPDIAVVTPDGDQRPTTATLVVEVSVTSQLRDLTVKAAVYAAADVEQYWVLDLPRREVVVHTEPGPAGYGTARRLPWTAPLEVLGVPVVLAEVLDRP